MARKAGFRHSKETKRKISERLLEIGHKPPIWNKNKHLSVEHKEKIKLAHLNNPNMVEYARLGATKRWENHIKVTKSYKYKYQSYKEKYPNGATERKRFTNMRYKAKKRLAEGSHTFEEWLILKTKYKHMCLYCKRQEPEIKLTEDHIIPLSMGGNDYIENIQPLCISCNTKKGTRDINYLSIGEKRDFIACPN